MTFRKIHISIFCLLVISLAIQAQEKWNFNGYLSGMPQYAWSTFKTDSLSQFERQSQYLLHNRLNFDWYPSDKITGTAQFRNQLMYGDFTKNSVFENGFQTESYFLPLTYLHNFGDAGLLSISTDRLWLQYTHNKLEVKLGRQRINWGQTFVWNPNDIFNAYNFFDFDYVERPGADAVRAIYYPSYTSSVDLAVKVDSGANVTAAGLFRFNKWGSDFQVIGGYYSQASTVKTTSGKVESDYMGGLGITSDMKGISLRTEASYFQPTTESADQNDLFLWSMGLDYSLKNELYLSGEYFYSSRVNLPSGNNIMAMYSGPLTVKNLAFATHNAFLQASYPITPLLKVTLSGMYFADETITGYFIGPYMDYSILDNLDLSLYFQYFDYNIKLMVIDVKSNTSFAFLRLKWSF